MHVHWPVSRVVLTLLLVGLLVSCRTGTNNTYGPTPLVAPGEVAAQLGTDAMPLILDVRTVEEYAQGHIPGAVNIPHYLLDERMEEVLAFKEKEVVVLCEVGVRAKEAEDYLKGQGFTQVKHLAGDMVRWRAERLPQTR